VIVRWLGMHVSVKDMV